MQKKGVLGQLNMFDFWSNEAEDSSGEVEMISLMPEEVKETTENEEAEPKEEIEKEAIEEVEETNIEEEIDIQINADLVKDMVPVMKKSKLSADGTIIKQVAFYNYNKVFVQNKDDEGKLYSFDNSKDAVDFYIEEIQRI